MTTTCIVCGCDDNHACSGGCAWAEIDTQGFMGEPNEFGICTACSEGDGPFFPAPEPIGNPGLILPGDPDFHL